MKKCPFCAEDIQDEAIKCRFCNSFLSAAPPPGAAGHEPPRPFPVEPRRGERVDEPRDHPRDEGRSGPFDRDRGAVVSRERRILYAGSPSWRAFVREYFFIVLGAIVVPILADRIAVWREVETFTRVLAILIPLALAVIGFFAVTFYRKSQVWRISTTNIESERGILNKKIDVLELWRCRDVRYRQSLFDRILQIAHIDIFTADVTSPQLEIAGVPASRQLFEQIRDSIEIQRHSRNVFGVVS